VPIHSKLRTSLLGLIAALAATSGAEAVCTESATAVCLNNDRFRVTATFETQQGVEGDAKTVALTGDTAYLWFFNANNVEMVVKILNGCGTNQRYWVFAGGLTNVKVELEVEDTQAGTSKTYTNPLGTAFQPLQDTQAFATCP
jgi:hypothetical protein